MRTGKCLECGLDWESASHCPDYACWQTLAEYFEGLLKQAEEVILELKIELGKHTS